MIVPAFCPHCGSDIRSDEPILLNDFSMYGDGYPLVYRGKPVHLTPGQSALCWSLLKAYPSIVRANTLILRMGSDCESNVIDVVISRIRAKLRMISAPNPIETIRGRGYRWSLVPIEVASRGGGRPRKAA
jgi:DNA-binding response OmpR family regulator